MSILMNLHDDLFSSIRGIGISDKNGYVRGVAIRMNDGVEIVRLRVDVGPDTPQQPKRLVITDHILAFAFHVDEISMTPSDFIRDVFSGKLTTPNATFDIRQDSSHLEEYRGELDDAAQFGTQQRWMVLKVQQVSNIPNITEALNWELRGHTEPYDGLLDLLDSFALLGMAEQFQAVVSILSVIDAESFIAGNKATIRVRMVEGLRPEDFRLGYRVLSRNGVNQRSSVDGSAFTWEKKEGLGYSTGIAEIDVPAASTMHCYAVYNGRAFHHWWLGDSKAPHNISRAILQLYDTDLGKLRDWIKVGAKRGDSRSLEAGVATIFWMGGFSVLHLGDNVHSNNAPDLIALTPIGHVVVVECTRGGLKTDAKMQKLMDRTLEIQDQLKASNAEYLRVLPVMVTVRPRSELEADLPDFERRGIIVIAQEELQTALERTLSVLSADQVFREFENTAANLKAKYSN